MVVASTRRRRSSGAGRGGALPLHAMRVLAVAGALPRVASESECPAGSIASITGHAACCPARCGRCGGKNCHQLADGHQSCCAAYIQKVGRTCNGTNPPCIPGQHGGEKPRFAHAALGPRSGPIKDGAIVRCAYRPNATFDAGTAGVDTITRATGCALHWVTVSPNREPKWHSVWKDVCHEHIVVRKMNTSAFWRERWRVVWRFLTNRPDVQHLMLTDTDIHVNPYTASEILERFDRMRRTKPESVVVATEETCWIGHVCSREQVARFQNAHSSKGRFIQSQYIGRRTDLLHMLEFGIASSESDDQRRIFDYSLAHPERVTLDYGQILFGSLALTELDALGHFVCGDGKCKSKSAPTRCISTEKRVCLAPDMGEPICPISWHGNGPFARDFLIRNRPCRAMLRFGTKHCTEAERFANVVSREDESNMMRLLDYFSRTCERHGIEYVIDGGTLVGSMLHHGRIPWDDDLDVYVRIEDRSRLEAAIDTHEYKISHHVGNGAYSKLWFKGTVHVENHRPWNWPFLDIGWLVTNETHAWEQRALTGENNGKYRRNVYPKTWLFPPVARPFGSLRLSAPRESERFLEYRFTSAWNSTCVVAHWDHRLEIWRYRDSGPTVAPCDTVSVDLVRRSRYPNGSSVEELTSSDERLVAVGRFEDDSLVSYSVMPSSVMPSKTMVHEATAHEWMDAAAHHHGDDRAAPAEPLDAPAEPLDADLYYINLQRRPDRNAALLRQLDRVGYDRAHVHRINATAHADDPMAGCLLSHVAALEAVVARAEAAGGGGGVGGGRPFALVLEDDFEWNDAALARTRLRAAFALQANWSVILLAGRCRSSVPPLAGRYAPADKCSTNTGYMIRNSYAPKLLELFRSADRARRAPSGSASRSWVPDGSRPTRLERARAHARSAHQPSPRASHPRPPTRVRSGVAAAAAVRRLAHDVAAPRPPGRRLQRHRAPGHRLP